MPKKRKQPELPTPAADTPTTTATTTVPNSVAATRDQDVEMADAAAPAAVASSSTSSTDDASTSRNCRRRTAYDWYGLEGLHGIESPEQWHEIHLDLIEREEKAELTANEEKEEDEDMELLITNATKTQGPSESHLAPIPLQIVYTRSEEEVEEARELIENPDAREIALDEVVHQLDHLPESIRTLLEELLEQHNADDHPLKYCSVEEFHTMIDLHVSPSGGGEYEYVGKLVQQLKEALKSSQQELTKYMKSKELDFNQMGPYLIEQKRITEELAKQTERLKSLESPLWQSCMTYLRDVRKLNLADEFLVMNPILWKVNQSNEAALAAASFSSSATTNSSPASIGLDAAAPESKEEDESTPPIDDATDPSADLDESADDSELVDEAIEETSRGRETRYEWMRDQIQAYETEREREGEGELTWMEVDIFLEETTFIGSEVKETIQALFKQDPFMINAASPVTEWYGWNFCKDENDTPLDPTLSSDRKLLRAIDALIDCIIELTDHYLDDYETRLDEHDALVVSAGGLVEFVHHIYPRSPTHSRFEDPAPKLVQSAEKLYEDISAEPEVAIGDDTRRATLLKLYGQAKLALLQQSADDQLIGRNHYLRGAACQLEASKTDLIIPRRSIEFLIRELAQGYTIPLLTPDYKWSPLYDFDPEAIDAIHHAAEAFLIQQFDTARADMKSISELLSHEKRKGMTETEEYVYTGTYRPDHTLTTLNLANGYATGRLSNCNAAFRYMGLSLVGSIGKDVKWRPVMTRSSTRIRLITRQIYLLGVISALLLLHLHLTTSPCQGQTNDTTTSTAEAFPPPPPDSSTGGTIDTKSSTTAPISDAFSPAPPPPPPPSSSGPSGPPPPSGPSGPSGPPAPTSGPSGPTDPAPPPPSGPTDPPPPPSGPSGPPPPPSGPSGASGPAPPSGPIGGGDTAPPPPSGPSGGGGDPPPPPSGPSGGDGGAPSDPGAGVGPGNGNGNGDGGAPTGGDGGTPTGNGNGNGNTGNGNGNGNGNGATSTTGTNGNGHASTGSTVSSTAAAGAAPVASNGAPQVISAQNPDPAGGPTASSTDFPVWAILLTVIIGSILLLFCALRCCNPTAAHFDVIIFCLAIIDFASDVWFIYTLRQNVDFSVIYQAAIAFTVIPFFFNFVSIMYLIYQELGNLVFRSWLHYNFATVTGVTLVACTNLDAIFILESELCHLPCFYVPWSHWMRMSIRMFGLITIFFEDIPQSILQIFVIASSEYQVVNVIALCSSVIMIFFGITKRALVCCVYQFDQRHIEREEDLQWQQDRLKYQREHPLKLGMKNSYGLPVQVNQPDAKPQQPTPWNGNGALNPAQLNGAGAAAKVDQPQKVVTVTSDMPQGKVTFEKNPDLIARPPPPPPVPVNRPLGKDKFDERPILTTDVAQAGTAAAAGASVGAMTGFAHHDDNPKDEHDSRSAPTGGFEQNKAITSVPTYQRTPIQPTSNPNDQLSTDHDQPGGSQPQNGFPPSFHEEEGSTNDISQQPGLYDTPPSHTRTLSNVTSPQQENISPPIHSLSSHATTSSMAINQDAASTIPTDTGLPSSGSTNSPPETDHHPVIQPLANTPSNSVLRTNSLPLRSSAPPPLPPRPKPNVFTFANTSEQSPRSTGGLFPSPHPPLIRHSTSFTSPRSVYRAPAFTIDSNGGTTDTQFRSSHDVFVPTTTNAFTPSSARTEQPTPRTLADLLKVEG